MGNSLCSPVVTKPEGKIEDAIEMLKKVARPASNWKALSPSLEPWFEELDSILKTIQERGVEPNAPPEYVQRTSKVCMGTVKGVHYWVKEINAQYNMGTDGPMISRASAVRLERTIKPHWELLSRNRRECIEKPATFFTYTMMSLRPALKESMRWVDSDLKSFDAVVQGEMEASKQRVAAAESGSTPPADLVQQSSRPITLYCDGHHVGTIDPHVYASKLHERH